MRLGLAVVVAIAVGRGNGIARQSASPPQTTFRDTIHVVMLDVTVLDRDRRPVSGLTSRDFTVLENGRAREIVAFTPITMPVPVTSGAEWMREIAPDVVTNQPRQGRIVVLMLDRTILAGRATADARRIALRAIDLLGPEDVAAVISTQPNATPQNFTSDRARLRAAVTSPAIGTSLSVRSTESGDCMCGVCSLHAIRDAANLLMGIQDRPKLLIFIGGSIAVNDHPTSTILTDCAEHTQPATAEMLDAAQRAHLVIHAVQPDGLTTPTPFSAQTRAPYRPVLPTDGGQQIKIDPASLQVLAENAGGRAVVRQNDVDQPLRQMFAESQSRYLIIFVPETGARPGFHPISVQVSRRNVDVHTRRGYYATGDVAPVAPIAAPRVPSALSEAVRAPFARSDLPMALAAAPIAVPGADEAAVALTLQLRQSARQSAPTHLRVITTVIDAEGRIIGDRTHEIDLTSSTRASSADYDLLSRIDLRPGRDELRLSAQDDVSGRLGSVYVYVDVPDFQKLAVSMSGPVIEITPSTVAEPKDPFAALLPLQPTGTREFPRTSRVRAFVRIYEGGGDPVRPLAVTWRIVDDHDRRVVEEKTTLGADRFDANRAVDYLVALPIDWLAPGEYLWEIDATLGKSTTKRDVRFSVR